MTPRTVEIEKPRDHRVDLLRGVALLAIVSSHVPGNRMAELLPSRLGLSDMAEVFVFLSGYAGGLATSQRLAREGAGRVLARSLIRSIRLYAAYVLTALVMLLTAVCLDVSLLPAGTTADISGLLTLQLPLGHLNILPMYMIFACLLPLLVLAVQRRPATVIALSLLVYTAVQVAPLWMALPDPWRESLYFNPLAWQVLFCGGACVALLKDWRSALLDSTATAAPAWGVLAGLLIWTALADGAALPAAGKGTLGPVRLLHFACVVIVVRAALPREHELWTSSRLEAVRVCGRQPLATYCCGACLSIVAAAMLRDWGSGWGLQAAVNVGAWTACFSAAWCAEWRRRDVSRRSGSSPGPESRSRTALDAAVPPGSPPTPPAAVPAG